MLRQAHPRLTIHQWSSLIIALRNSGNRVQAAQIARVAQRMHTSMHKVLSSPHVSFCCPMPKYLLFQFQKTLRAALHRLPSPLRLPPFQVAARCAKLCWRRSPYVTQLLAANRQTSAAIGPCSCHCSPGHPRLNGHIITRQWSSVSCCGALGREFGSSSLQVRTFPAKEFVVQDVLTQLEKLFKRCGFPKDDVGLVLDYLVGPLRLLVEKAYSSIRICYTSEFLRKQLRYIHQNGFVFVPIDRNPGRLILLCNEAWSVLQRAAFLTPRYELTPLPCVSDDPTWVQSQIDGLGSALASVGSRMWPHLKPRCPSRPTSSFTIKQKSIIHSAEILLLSSIRLRPLIAHHLHPLRAILRRVARALSLLVEAAIPHVCASRSSHTPMWRLHKGTAAWLNSLAENNVLHSLRQLVEYDVADCFLNTPRNLVLRALRYWLDIVRKRGQLYFSISKDNKAADYIGKSTSAHFYTFSEAELVAVVSWELEHNDLFECLAPDRSCTYVLRQVKGLPMGGHLSAALVELVALHREHTQPWPPLLGDAPSARYRDNFFVAFAMDPSAEELAALACSLTGMLCMPVKLEGSGRERRVLEVRIQLRSDIVHSTLAFRDDTDRQGESGDVVSWPPASDPRVKQLLPGLLSSLAARIRQYHPANCHGVTSSWRRAVQFLRRRHYPTKWWLRPFAIAAVRHGARLSLLPRCLRRALLCPQSDEI